MRHLVVLPVISILGLSILFFAAIGIVFTYIIPGLLCSIFLLPEPISHSFIKWLAPDTLANLNYSISNQRIFVSGLAVAIITPSLSYVFGFFRKSPKSVLVCSILFPIVIMLFLNFVVHNITS